MFWKKPTTLEPDPPKPPEPKTQPIELWEAHIGRKMHQSCIYITPEDVEKLKAANRHEFVEIQPYIWRYGTSSNPSFGRLYMKGLRMQVKPEMVVAFQEIWGCRLELVENQDVN